MNYIARFFVVYSLLFVGVFGVTGVVTATEDVEVIPEEVIETPVDDIEIPVEATTATIIITKLVCPNEANLPNFGLGGPDVTEETVNGFLSIHPNCYRVGGWSFQYDTTLAQNPGDNMLGEAGSPWMTTLPTDANGETSFEVAVGDVSEIRVREVMQSEYIGFTHGDAADNSLGYTAELYCGNDVLNYDNFDFIREPQAGETYRCVAWNAPVRTYPAFCGNGVVDQSWEACDGGESCTAQCQVASEQCTENVFARLVVTNTQNLGYGDVTDIVYVGGTAQPDFAWFPVKLSGLTVIDPAIDTFQNVAGLALERSLDGIRVRLFGSHDDGSQEHSEGYVEFSNGTTLLTQTDETGANKVENATDGIMEVASGQDEIWVAGNLSHYWFTVTTKNDGFITTYQGPMCEADIIDLCSNIDGDQESVPEGMTASEGICTVSDNDDEDENNEENGGNGGNGGSGGGSPAPACADGSDNDNDGKADYPADLGCTSSLDSDESGDGTTPTSASAGNGIGTTTGEVLGASTTEPVLPPSCGAYIDDYMKFGKKNNVEQVKKLQSFLNETMGENIPVTGYFGGLTRDLVKKFQKKYHAEILKPWVDAGWKGKDLENGTGYVFKTTKRWVNLMKCQSLDLPIPDLKAN